MIGAGADSITASAKTKQESLYTDYSDSRENGEWIYMIIRQASPDDTKRLLEIYAYYVANTAVSFEYDVPTEADFRGRIHNTLQKYPYLVLEEDGIIQGYAYAGVFKSRAAYSRSCELSIYVDRDARRRGYGRKLYETLEDSLKKQGIVNLCLYRSPCRGR